MSRTTQSSDRARNTVFLQNIEDRLVPKDQSLEGIYVNNRPEFGDSECRSLASRLVGSSVEKIIVQKTCMSGEGATAIAEALTLTRVKIVRMRNNNIGDRGCVAFAKLLSSPNCCVTEIILARNNIGNDGCRKICQGLTNNSSVTTVSLTANHISCYQGIIDMLRVNKTITKINLIGNQNLDAPDLPQAFVDVAERNYYLEFLVVWDYPILSTAQRQINFFTEFNRAGRRTILQEDNVPTAIWPKVLCKVKEADYIFYFLKAKPELFQNHKQGQPQESSSDEADDTATNWIHIFPRKRRRAGDHP